MKRCNFHSLMDEPSQDIHNLAQDLFDHNGNLRDYHHGTFGPETNQGNLIYILDVDLQEHLHNKGYGCQAVRQLLAKLNQRAAQAVAALPEVDYDLEPEEWGEMSRQRSAQERKVEETAWSFAVLWREKCEADWRPAGFRRIAHSRFLGCVRNPRHACWNQTAPDAPWPPPRSELQDQDIRLRRAVQGLADTDPGYLGGIPGARIDFDRVRQAIANGGNIARAAAMQYAMAVENMDLLRLLVQLGGQYVNEADDLGIRPLHVAASGKNMEAVRLLLAAGADPLRTNNLGANVLESFYRQLVSGREFQDAMLHGFSGFPEEDMQMYIYLRAMTAQAMGDAGASLRTLHSKWGCTCGQCVGGWLSPRMVYRLRWCAEYYGNTIDDEDLPKDAAHLLTEDEVSFIGMAEFLPLDMQQRLRRPVVLGYAQCMRGIAALLDAHTPQLPTATALNALLTSRRSHIGRYPLSVRNHKAYLSAGGRVEYAIAGVIAHMRDSSEAAGNGEFNELTGECADEEMAELHACANDDDYHMAMRQLCDAGFQPRWGPFFGGSALCSDSEEEGLESDEEDEGAGDGLIDLKVLERFVAAAAAGRPLPELV